MKEEYFSVMLDDSISGSEIIMQIERYGRTCYKSEDKLSSASAAEFVRMIIGLGHESVLEHEKVTLRIVCDRGISHEIVRHRIGSYSQESTRYCNYSTSKFGNEITCIAPIFHQNSEEKMMIWRSAMCAAESAYFSLLSLGATPQEARAVLPTSLKTEIVVTYNLREWRHFLKLRTAVTAHPQMVEIAHSIHNLLKDTVPIVFDDL